MRGRGALDGPRRDETEKGAAAVVNPDWGIKRACQACSALFYDFHRDPITCPKCGAEFDPEAVLKSRRARVANDDKPRVAVAAKAEKAEEEPAEAEAEEAEAEEAEAEEAGDDEAAEIEESALGDDDDELPEEEDEEDVIEDASELGEDEDDMAEVIEHREEKEER